MITSEFILNNLISGIKNTKVTYVGIGFNFILLESPKGCGLAQTPSRNTAGCSEVRQTGNLKGISLKELATWVTSENPIEIAIGIAAINASYNRYDLESKNENGLSTLRKLKGPVTTIGRFPGLSKYISNARIIEKEPRTGEYGIEDTNKLISDSEGVVITSSTLINKTIGPILESAKDKFVCLIGPSTPLAPSLFKLGINVLAGTLVTDLERMKTHILEGGAVKSMKNYSTFKTLIPE
ncbi:MAG: hypothetical protein ISQ90_04980 [Rhodospirillales bacterium]|jgi:uncharacterized protein (DUF4213/DUF364 family)|nr:hypothetical protein [Rhodospirillales bacterium]MDC0989134.1 DUF364 domain-containing protein [Rhodospirillales bacterium]